MGILFVLVLSTIFFLYCKVDVKKDNIDKEVEVCKYQGAVQEGYDEQLFRDTGVYKKSISFDNF
jgi:hypothetical protein